MGDVILEAMRGTLGDLNKQNALKFGYNTDIDNTWEDLVVTGGTLVLPASAAAVHLVSDNVEDDILTAAPAAGTGIHTVKIFYLTNTYVPKTETINLNGTGIVATTATDIYRIQKCIATVVGTGGGAAGSITLKDTTNTHTYGTIAVGNHRLFNGALTVPIGKKLLLTGFTAGVQKADGSAIGEAYFRVVSNYSHELEAATSYFVTSAYFPVYGSAWVGLGVPMTFPAGTTVKLQALGLAADSNFLCAGCLEGLWINA